MAAIVELIRESTWPIIMTANNPWDPKLGTEMKPRLFS